MKIPIYQVDAFTVTPLKGNRQRFASWKNRIDEWMQCCRGNESRRFLTPQGDDYQLRWLPQTGWTFAATPFSARISSLVGFYEPDGAIRFNTKPGLITATSKNDRTGLCPQSAGCDPGQ